MVKSCPLIAAFALALSLRAVGSLGRRTVAAEIRRHDIEQHADFRVHQPGTDTVLDFIQRTSDHVRMGRTQHNELVGVEADS